MPTSTAPTEVSTALNDSLRLLVRRLRQRPPTGELSGAASQALTGLIRHGPASSADLARQEGISPQSMGATIAGLEALGLVERRADPSDGRRVIFSPTTAGRERAESKRAARADQLARALRTGFSPDERAVLLAAAPLLERLAKTL